MRGLALAVCCALAGCARGVRPAEEPPLAVVDRVEVAFDSDTEGRFGLTLSVVNPTEAAGTLTRVDWELWLSGRQFAAGTRRVEVALVAGARMPVSFEVPIVFRRRTLVEQAVSVEVGVRGRVELMAAEEVRELPFALQERQVLSRSPARDVVED